MNRNKYVAVLAALLGAAGNLAAQLFGGWPIFAVFAKVGSVPLWQLLLSTSSR
jgi:hypothetical protein